MQNHTVVNTYAESLMISNDQSNDLGTGGLMVGHQLKQQMHLLRNKQLEPLTPP